ncbi:MAG: carbohydrate-binding domain-containing protein [Chitinispirillales bacterium]|jgi:hypothetical protein|nr:carbohydrate-binding domain-containing protein [Chitinispirillales bacterium]
MKRAAWIFLKGVFDGRGRALLSTVVLAVGMQAGWAQDDDSASVPFIVNVNATVSATDGVTPIQISVQANQEAILRIPLQRPDGIRFFGTRRQTNAPSIVSVRNGKVTINLPARSYKNAEISLYTVSGKRILRAKTSALSAVNNISRPNLANGVYMLSVRGTDGAAVTSRLTHDGGGLSINAVFGGENVSASKHLAKETAAGDWNITVRSAGYVDTNYTLHPVAGLNTLQNITLRIASEDNGPGAWDPVWAPCQTGAATGGLNLSRDDLGLDSHFVVIKFNNGSAPTVTYSTVGRTVTDTINGEHVKLAIGSWYYNNSVPYNIILSGTARNGSLWVNGGKSKTLYLNGVNITSQIGAAINNQTKNRMDVHLVGCDSDKRNTLKDGSNYSTGEQGGERAKGAFFSEGSLVFGGSGSLEIYSKNNHAIVSEDHITVSSGRLLIYESPKDGLHANDSINIRGGDVQIKCKGDAIQNEKRKPITVSGGKIKIRTFDDPKGHGIVSDSGEVIISGDATNIDITLTGNGSKGIRSRGNVKINGATTSIEAYGSRESLTDDTSSAAGIKADGDVEITRGVLTIKSVKANENGKGLNIDGNLRITGGTTRITSDGDGVRVRGSITMSGGILESKSANKKDIDCDGRITRTGGTLLADNIRQGTN